MGQSACARRMSVVRSKDVQNTLLTGPIRNKLQFQRDVYEGASAITEPLFDDPDPTFLVERSRTARSEPTAHPETHPAPTRAEPAAMEDDSRRDRLIARRRDRLGIRERNTRNRFFTSEVAGWATWFCASVDGTDSAVKPTEEYSRRPTRGHVAYPAFGAAKEKYFRLSTCDGVRVVKGSALSLTPRPEEARADSNPDTGTTARGEDRHESR
jgi:hypothetical protein